MASWAQLKEVVSQNLKVMQDDGNMLTLIFTFQDGREHEVIVARAGNHQIGEWAQVEAAFGKFDEVDIAAAVRKSEEILCGGVASNGDFATLRHSAPLANLDAEEILIPIQAIVSSANDFAQEFGATQASQ